MSKYQIQEKQTDGTMENIYPVTQADYVQTTNEKSVQGVLDDISGSVNSLSSALDDVKTNVQNGVVSAVTVSGSGSSGRVNVTKGGATTSLLVPYATKAGSLSNTSDVGSISVPVYINSYGAPTATGYNLATMTANIATATKTANDAKSLAEGKSAAKSYESYEAMVTAVNAMANTDMKVGDNIYIATLDVPDIWVSGVNTTKTTYTYSSDSVLASALKSSGGVSAGYYILKALETNKVDLTNYVAKDYTGTISASISGNAATATKATQDQNGNNIASTYAEKKGVVGGVNYTSATNTVSVVDGTGAALNSFIPANDKVKTSPKSDALDYAVVFVTGSTVTSDTTSVAYKSAGFMYNPSTQTLTSKVFKGNATSATKLSTIATISVSVGSGTKADGTTEIPRTLSSNTFDGSSNISFTPTLGDSGVTAGTYSAVQVNAKGIAVAGGQMIQIAQSTTETASASLAIGGLFFKKLD